jgi:hypothetical protein
VPGMPLQFIKIPVLVVHHKDDGCDLCRYTDLPLLTEKLSGRPAKRSWCSRAAPRAATRARPSRTTATTGSSRT